MTSAKDMEREPEISEPILHGGDLTAARARFGEPAAPWLDLSTGINPVSYPLPALPVESWTRLPDAGRRAALEAAAAAAFGAVDPAMVVAAPGTQALIQLLPRLQPVQSVAVVGFTYQEHARVWRALGVPVAEVASLAEAIDAHADVTVIVNPNNPDGRCYDPATLEDFACRLGDRGGTLLVDEAFADLEGEDVSLIPRLPAGRAIVLRSFGKTYGLAGLRLGFVVSDADTASLIRRDLGPWAVSGPALEIGLAAYGDAAWRAAAAERLCRDGDRLDRLMMAAGFESVGGTRLFRLYAHDDAAAWYGRLGRAGILVRPFPARPRWLRLGLPGGEADWARLEAALTG